MQKKSLLGLLMIVVVCGITNIVSCKKEIIDPNRYDDIEGIYCSGNCFSSFASVLRKNNESEEFEYTLLMKKYIVMQGDMSVGFNIVDDQIIVPLQIDTFIVSRGETENEESYLTFSRKGIGYVDNEVVTIYFEEGHSISSTIVYTKQGSINTGNYGIGTSTVQFVTENDDLVVKLNFKAEDLSLENDIVCSVKNVDFIHCDFNIYRQNINELEKEISASMSFDEGKLKIRLHVFADSNALDFKKIELELDKI